MKVPLNRDDERNPPLGTRSICTVCGYPIVFDAGFMFDHWRHVGAWAVSYSPTEHFASTR